MNHFTESNTVEALIRDLLCGPLAKTPQRVAEGLGTSPARRTSGLVEPTIFAPCRGRVSRRGIVAEPGQS